MLKRQEIEAQPITVTSLPDGQHVAHLPLPAKAVLSSHLLGLEAGGLVETVIEFRFANRQARYRLCGVDSVGNLIAELVQESEHKLAPYVPADPKTMGPKLAAAIEGERRR